MRMSGVLSRRMGALIAGLALAVGMIGVSAESAEARSRHRGYQKSHHRAHQVHFRKYRAKRVHFARRGGRSAGGPPFAAMIVDANSGRTLYARNENELRYPASVTKVMTLYMLFEQMERGRFRLDSPLTVSAHAASMAPSKLGLRPGAAIEVEDAIRALVTKSANDVAATVAEAVGGDEETFAEMMTRKARALGMYRTVYKNASGLPNPGQVTTAHDLTILGRAIQDRFPKYYRYFATRSFYWAGRSHRNHNHLLGRVEGMDGIKTGYTNASGFNLLTSVRRDGRHIVGVVLGGRSGASRDMIMANLIAENLDSGARGRTAVAMAETSNDREETVRPLADPARAEIQREPARESARLAFAEQPRPEPVVREPAARPEPARIEPARAVARPDQPRLEPMQLAGLREERNDAGRLTPPAPIANARPVGLQLSVPPSPIARPGRPRPAFVSGAVRTAALETPAETTATIPQPRAPVVTDGSTARKNASVQTATPAATLRWVKGPEGKPAHKADTKHGARGEASEKESGRTVVARARHEQKPEPKAEARTDSKPGKPGWIIQIGATDEPGKATELLNRAKGKSRAIASAHAVTEKVQKGKETLWRARFAGLQESAAEAACKDLKRSGFACFAMKN